MDEIRLNKVVEMHIPGEGPDVSLVIITRKEYEGLLYKLDSARDGRMHARMEVSELLEKLRSANDEIELLLAVAGEIAGIIEREMYLEGFNEKLNEWVKLRAWPVLASQDGRSFAEIAGYVFEKYRGLFERLAAND